MEFASSIATPLVVEVKDKTCLVFKKHPYKSMKDNLGGSFSFVLHGILHVGDV